jgi:uncharacterized protein
MAETVKIVLARRVRPGARAQFEQWLKDLLAQAATFPGLQGSSVLSAEDDYFILMRFADHGELVRWQQAPEVLRLLAAATPLAAAGERTQLRTGLETWFTLPGHTVAGAGVPKWKMALVTWLALLPQVIVLALLLPPMPFPLGAAVSTAIPVAMLAWVVMPWLTRRLYPWLYREPVRV